MFSRTCIRARAHTYNDYGLFSHPSSSSLLNATHSPSCGWSLGSMLCALSNITSSLRAPPSCTIIFYAVMQSMSSPNHFLSIPCTIPCFILSRKNAQIEFGVCLILLCAFLHAMNTTRVSMRRKRATCSLPEVFGLSKPEQKEEEKKACSYYSSIMETVILMCFILLPTSECMTTFFLFIQWLQGI